MSCPLARAAAMVTLLAACDHSPVRRDAADRALGARLNGLWDATFRLAHTPRGAAGADGMGPNTVRGTLALLERAGDAPIAAPLAHPATHTGVHDLNFRPLGFALRPTGRLPGLIAATAAPDSLVALLPADGEADGTLVLRGTVDADSAHGAWRFATRAMGGWSGTFTMRRRANASR